MNAFEHLVGTVLRAQGYWTAHNYKVHLTKGEKRKIDRPSAPRWELDILAYKGRGNEVLVVECKSYLDSRGVVFNHLKDKSKLESRLYKLFTDTKLRRVVFSRVQKQLVDCDACAPNPTIRLALAAGKFATTRDAEQTDELFAKNGWRLFNGASLAKQLRASTKGSYEDDVGMIAAKLLDRYPIWGLDED